MKKDEFIYTVRKTGKEFVIHYFYKEEDAIECAKNIYYLINDKKAEIKKVSKGCFYIGNNYDFLVERHLIF